MAVVCGLMATPVARAAQLSVEGPQVCLDPAALGDEIDDLIGRPLADVGNADFRVQIAERAPGKWRLRSWGG